MTDSVAPDTGAAPPNDADTDLMPRVVRLDHVVLRVSDPERSVAWYVEKLGLVPDRLEEYRRGEVPFPSVRIDANTVIDLDGRKQVEEGRNVEHFCVEIAPTDLAKLSTSTFFSEISTPVRRWGARGEADLVYVQDPDGHVIELRHYGPTQGFGYTSPT
ncbi:MAG: VOC family protein [Actinomycetota bacterium]|nr:VOC family protein [Actinomycetota bacterium]